MLTAPSLFLFSQIVVMVMCFDDCPEETQWVHDTAQNVDLIIGIVAGLDLTKHDKLEEHIKKFKNFKKPKFVGIRHHICYNSKLLFCKGWSYFLSLEKLAHNIKQCLSKNEIQLVQ